MKSALPPHMLLKVIVVVTGTVAPAGSTDTLK